MKEDRNFIGEPAKQEDKPRVNYGYVFLLVLLVCLVVNTVSFYIYDRYMAPKIYVYDLKQFVKEQRDKYLKGLITEDDFKKSVIDLDAKIKSLPENAIVITKDVILKGGMPLEREGK